MKRGEIWKVNLDPAVGAEIKKTRPCVIVGRDALSKLPLTIVVPLTDWNQAFAQADWHVLVKSTAQNGLSKDSSADTYQVRSISVNRLVEKLGEISITVMAQIGQGLVLSLALDKLVV